MITSEWDETGEYTVALCDSCKEQKDTLYDVGGKHLCLNCLLERDKEEFIGAYWDDIVDQYGEDYAEAYDVVEID